MDLQNLLERKDIKATTLEMTRLQPGLRLGCGGARIGEWVESILAGGLCTCKIPDPPKRVEYTRN